MKLKALMVGIGIGLILFVGITIGNLMEEPGKTTGTIDQPPSKAVGTVAKPEPTPIPTPTPEAGLPFLEYSAHVLTAMTDIQHAIENMVGAWATYDLTAMADGARRVSDLASAELIWANSVDPQPCYQGAVDAYRTMLSSVAAAYLAAQLGVLAVDVNAINAASDQIAVSNGLIADATTAIELTRC